MEKEKNVGKEGIVVSEEVVEVVAAPEETKNDRFLPVSIIIAAVLIGGALVFSSLHNGGQNAPVAPAGAPSLGGTAASSTPAEAMVLGPHDAILGSANAPVTLIEYGDYQCPFCTMFFTQTQPSIVSDYVNTNKVRMVFRDFPFLGPESTAAAEAAQCAEAQNKFWDYHNALYAAKVSDEQKGGGENDGFLNRTLFLQLARNVGLNVATFTSCIDSTQNASLVVQEKAAAAAAGVNSTPSFFVNGTPVVGAQPYSAFKQVIDAALKAS